MADIARFEMKLHELNDKLRAALARIDKLEKKLNVSESKS